MHTELKIYLCLDHLVSVQAHIPNKGVDINTLFSAKALHLSVESNEGPSTTNTSTASERGKGREMGISQTNGISNTKFILHVLGNPFCFFSFMAWCIHLCMFGNVNVNFGIYKLGLEPIPWCKWFLLVVAWECQFRENQH